MSLIKDSWIATKVFVAGPNRSGNIQREYMETTTLGHSWRISEDLPTLAQRLQARAALTTPTLLDRGDHADQATVATRWLRLLAPILAIMVALPSFVRFANHHQLLVAGVKATAQGQLPLAGLFPIGLILQNSSLSPWPITAVSTLVMLSICYQPWRRWTL